MILIAQEVSRRRARDMVFDEERQKKLDEEIIRIYDDCYESLENPDYEELTQIAAASNSLIADDYLKN